MKIAEIYRSIQGEGLLTGTPSVFVRTQRLQSAAAGFATRPTPVGSPKGTDLGVDEIFEPDRRVGWPSTWC